MKYPLKPRVTIGVFLNVNAECAPVLQQWRAPKLGYCWVVQVTYAGHQVLHALPNQESYRRVMRSAGLSPCAFYTVKLENLVKLSPEAVAACKENQAYVGT